MDDAAETKKSWLLRAELVVLVCLACFCVVKPSIVNMDSAKAGVFKKVIDMLSNDADVAPHEKAVVTAIFYNEDNPNYGQSDSGLLAWFQFAIRMSRSTVETLYFFLP